MSMDAETRNDPNTLFAAYQITILDEEEQCNFGWFDRLVYKELEKRFQGLVYTRAVWAEKIAVIRAELEE